MWDWSRDVKQNSAANFPFEDLPNIDPLGFRQCDARWWLDDGSVSSAPLINLSGVFSVGNALGNLLQSQGQDKRIIIGHDLRRNSPPVNQALAGGLVSAGMQVHDIGLVITPAAYFAQHHLKIPNLAMVTASHNPDGWAGLKLSDQPALTFGPEKMAALRDFSTNGEIVTRSGGVKMEIDNFRQTYVSSLCQRPKFTRKIRAVIACGNGSAGFFAPEILENLGVDVIPLHCDPDAAFPNHHPDPEGEEMLCAMAQKQNQSDADIALGFDGDGDRCGVVDDRGRIIPADKIGLLLARDISAKHPGRKFIIDIKSTMLFGNDPDLAANEATIVFSKTGHSHIKHLMAQTGAIAGFEKSGHFYFAPPIGNGYDDAMIAAIQICELLERNGDKTLSELVDELPPTHCQQPKHIPCGEVSKRKIIQIISDEIQTMKMTGTPFAGQIIIACETLDGIRATLADGSWVLARASSNGPYLVVVGESLISKSHHGRMINGMIEKLRGYCDNPAS